jgi:hypothetical protein
MNAQFRAILFVYSALIRRRNQAVKAHGPCADILSRNSALPLAFVFLKRVLKA